MLQICWQYQEGDFSAKSYEWYWENSEEDELSFSLFTLWIGYRTVTPLWQKITHFRVAGERVNELESISLKALLLVEDTKQHLLTSVPPSQRRSSEVTPLAETHLLLSGANAAAHLDLVKLMVSLSDCRRNWIITDEHAPRKQDFSTWLGRLMYFSIFCFMHRMYSSVQKLIIR